MTVFLVMTLVAVCGLLTATVGLFVRRGTARPVSRVEDLESRLESIDLLAFQNLIDPEESRFLHQQLPPRRYRRIQRLRTRAAMAYVQSIYRNAGLTIRLAEQLSKNPQAEIREEALKIQELSIHARILALRSIIKLTALLVFPSLETSAQDLTEGYAKIADRIESVCVLIAPLYTSRIAAAFK